MGIDARIEFRPTTRLTEKERKHLAARLNEAMGSVDYCFYEDVDGAAPTYSLINPWRYYGPGYERGPWPSIAAVLMALHASPDVEKVWYFGDCSDGDEPFTPQLVQEFSAHYMTEGDRPYRGAFKNIGMPRAG